MHSPNYVTESYIDQARKQKPIEFSVLLDLPKTTRQATLRIYKRKDGKSFIGKDKKSSLLDQRLDIWCKKFIPLKPLFGPLEVSIIFTYKWRKGEPKRNRNSPVPMFKRPDVDNLAKGTLDWLSNKFFYDDAQICKLHLEKYWNHNSSLQISIKPL
jgi:Holliday junction resolvase RusA-like endonuclease